MSSVCGGMPNRTVERHEERSIIANFELVVEHSSIARPPLC